MKNTFFLTLFYIAFAAASCSKHKDVTAPQGPKTPFIKDTGTLLFKIIPLSPHEMKILFIYQGSRSLNKLYLKKDTTTVGSYDISDDLNNNWSADIQFGFDSTASYNFSVLTNAVNDTIYRYTISGYHQIYASAYNTQQVLALNPQYPLTGANSFDISPSRKYIFLSDYSTKIVNGTVDARFTIRRLSLTDFTADTVPGNLIGLFLRAVSDSVLLLQTGVYNGRYLGGDSTALVLYNINDTSTKFVDWASQNYGRYSRIVNNHILVTNPVNFAPGDTESLIDLGTGTKITYPQSFMDFRFIGQVNFDNIYYYNQVVNTSTGAIASPLPAGNMEAVEYVDGATGYAITTNYYALPNNSYRNNLNVYKNQASVYRGDTASGRSFSIPRIMRINNGTLLFYQYFDYGTTFNTDGYYTLDVNTKKITLVQSFSTPYVSYDFQLDDTHIISVRTDGVYRLTR